MAAPTGLVHRLAERIVALRFDDIPRDVVEKTKAIVLHDLAIAFGGIGTDQVRIALSWCESNASGATIIGSNIAAPAEDAAFVNSVIIRALRMEDSIIPSFIHPGASLLPAALALGETYRASGADFLCALIAGYEILGRLAGSLRSLDYGSRSSHHVFGAFGVAAVASRLLQLSTAQTAGALAYAGDLGAMITYGFQDFQYGVVTRNGLFAARLGAAGAPFPDDALEGPYGFYAGQLGGDRPQEAEILADWGRHFEIMSAVLKPHPCTALNLVPINMIRQELQRSGLAPGDIARLRIRRARTVGRVPNIHSSGPFEGHAGGASAAISSLPFALAVLLTEGEIAPRAFDNVNDPRFKPVMAEVAIEVADGLDLLDHEVAIETRNGGTIELRGGIEYLPRPDARKLLATYAQPVIGAASVERLIGAVEGIDTAKDLTAIALSLRPGERRSP